MTYQSMRSGNMILCVDTQSYVNPETNQEYIAWLAEGNTPLPPDPPSKAELDAPVLAKLEQIDRESIPFIRAWIAKQADAPKELVECETAATAERAKLNEP